MTLCGTMCMCLGRLVGVALSTSTYLGLLQTVVHNMQVVWALVCHSVNACIMVAIVQYSVYSKGLRCVALFPAAVWPTPMSPAQCSSTGTAGSLAVCSTATVASCELCVG